MQGFLAGIKMPPDGGWLLRDFALFPEYRIARNFMPTLLASYVLIVQGVSRLNWVGWA
jgi:hypothetical protein